MQNRLTLNQKVIRVDWFVDALRARQGKIFIKTFESMPSLPPTPTPLLF